MSESAAPASAPSAGESSPSETASIGSTSPSSENNSTPSEGGSSSGGDKASQAAHASEVVDALENAEQKGSMFEVVIDGEKHMLTADQLKAGYQKAAASAKRFAAAAEKEKAALALESETKAKREAMRKNPLKFLMEDGVDEASARNHYETAVWEWMQQDKMSPEEKEAKAKQKEFETEKQKLAREKEEIAKWKAEREAEKEEKEIERHKNDYANQIQSILTKHNLPKSPVVVNKLIEIMKDGLSYDDTFTFEDAAELYKEDNQSGIEEYLKSLTPEQLMAKMGPDFVKQWRKQDVQANVKNPTPPAKKPHVDQPKSKDSKISSKDFFANLGKR